MRSDESEVKMASEMMELAINELTIEEAYGWLLKKKRQHEKMVADGTAKCLHCQQQKSVHLGDDRCSVYATSRTFRNEQQVTVDKIVKAIALIEELMEL